MSHEDVLIGTPADLFPTNTALVLVNTVVGIGSAKQAAPISATSVTALPTTILSFSRIGVPLVWPITSSQVGYVPTGVVLTDFGLTDGSATILSTPNQVIDGARFYGRVHIKAPGVVIKRSLIRMTGNINEPGRPFNDSVVLCDFPTIFQDTEIDGNDLDLDSLIGWDNYELHRCWVHGGGDAARAGTVGIPATNIKIYDSYLGPNWDNINNSGHNDSFQMTGGSGVFIQGSTLDATTSNSGNLGTGFLVKADFSDISNVTVDHCYFKSGQIGMIVQRGPGQTESGYTGNIIGGITVTNSVFNKPGFTVFGPTAYGWQSIGVRGDAAGNDQSGWLYANGNRYQDGSVINDGDFLSGSGQGYKIAELPDMGGAGTVSVLSVVATSNVPIPTKVVAGSANASVTKVSATATIGAVTVIAGNSGLNPRNTPGGPDPFGGVFPGTANTGYLPTGVTLTTYAGAGNITSGTYDSKDFAGDFTIASGATVIITRSRITGSIQNTGSGSLSMTDVELIGNNADQGNSVIFGQNITCLRLNVHGGKANFQMEDNCSITDSYMHSPFNSTTVLYHYDCIGSNGCTGVNIQHCSVATVFSNPGQGLGGGSADIGFFGDFGVISHVTINQTLFVASSSNGDYSYALYPNGSTGKPNPINDHFVVTNCVFQKGVSGRCGQFGVLHDWAFNTGDVWTGNTFDDGTAIIE